MISIQFEDTEVLDVSPEFFVLWFTKVCESEGVDLGEIGVVYCSDEYILNANNRFLNHDYYTDIITFDYREGSVISGDLLISIDRVKENAESAGELWMRELNRVMVHGVLHIIGYKDKTTEEARLMREKEEFYLGFT